MPPATPTRNAKRPAPDGEAVGPRPIPCPYCGEEIPIDNKDHYLFECPELNKVFDPGGNRNVYVDSLSPQALRLAGMTTVRLLTDTPRSIRPDSR